eukprot:g7106.t1
MAKKAPEAPTNYRKFEGPIKKRRCRDCWFLPFFVAFWGFLAYVIYQHLLDDPEMYMLQRAYLPIDTLGRFCGKGNDWNVPSTEADMTKVTDADPGMVNDLTKAFFLQDGTDDNGDATTFNNLQNFMRMPTDYLDGNTNKAWLSTTDAELTFDMTNRSFLWYQVDPTALDLSSVLDNCICVDACPAGVDDFDSTVNMASTAAYPIQCSNEIVKIAENYGKTVTDN